MQAIKIISIHAPREGSDGFVLTLTLANPNFYPRSPRGERLETAGIQGVHQVFLSTLPARGATKHGRRLVHYDQNFYPRSPRGERPLDGVRGIVAVQDFYPRSPRGERPENALSYGYHSNFYPRSPRGERPAFSWISLNVVSDFYPRSPRGERRAPAHSTASCGRFLSTLPARGATRKETQK